MSKVTEQILIIDDMVENIQILARLLEDDYEIRFATSGKRGIELALKTNPDLILLDVMMPEMDGFETCSRLKEDEKLKDVPVIFVTALTEKYSETRALEIGAVDYITKPICPETVRGRVKNHIALRIAHKELQAKNRELESFCLAISHDVRAPLRIIKGVSQILLEDCAEKIDETDRKNIEKINSSCTNLENLVSNLLRFSFISSSELKISKFDLSKMAEEVCTSLSESLPLVPAEIKVAPGMEITADQELIRVVVTNLINNAWKYSSKKDKIIIEVGVIKNKKEYAYFVKDSGAGFDMKYENKLFGAFQRLHSAKDFEGTGLGMFISQRIIQKHGGKIWAKGEENVGATFYFTIPSEKSPEAS
ncbi:MAG: response regulator [Candidatus Riflebacteria bacterium]|nr:response regulator [Candidatus Riflebacteria bacterium]